MLQTIQPVPSPSNQSTSHQWFLPERTVVLPWSWTGPHVSRDLNRGYPLPNVDPLLPRLTGNPQRLPSMWRGCGGVDTLHKQGAHAFSSQKARLVLTSVRHMSSDSITDIVLQDWWLKGTSCMLPVFRSHSRYRESQAAWIVTPDECGVFKSMLYV